MFKPLIIGGHKLLRADDARIHRIACAVSEPIASTEFKPPAAILFKKLIFKYLDLPLFRLSNNFTKSVHQIDNSQLFNSFLPFTNNIRSQRKVVIHMGDTTYITPSNDYLAKPMVVAINDADGSVVWAKKYFEGKADYVDSYKHYITGYAVNMTTLPE